MIADPDNLHLTLGSELTVVCEVQEFVDAGTQIMRQRLRLSDDVEKDVNV